MDRINHAELKQFLLLLDTTQSSDTAQIVLDCLEHPDIYYFTDLLDHPRILQVMGTCENIDF